MSLDVSRPVLPLTVGLVDWFPVNLGASLTSAPVVHINVIDIHDQPGIANVDGPRGIQAMLSSDPM